MPSGGEGQEASEGSRTRQLQLIGQVLDEETRVQLTYRIQPLLLLWKHMQCRRVLPPLLS